MVRKSGGALCASRLEAIQQKLLRRHKHTTGQRTRISRDLPIVGKDWLVMPTCGTLPYYARLCAPDECGLGCVGLTAFCQLSGGVIPLLSHSHPHGPSLLLWLMSAGSSVSTAFASCGTGSMPSRSSGSCRASRKLISTGTIRRISTGADTIPATI